jgi:hypothetical protein
VLAAGRRLLDNIDVLLLGLARDDEVASVAFLIVVLDDGIVGNAGLRGISRSLTHEQGRTSPDVVKLEGVILLDDLAVHEGDEEESGEGHQAETSSKTDGNDEPSRLLVELQIGRALVDDGQGTNGTSDQEEEWGGENSPLDRILADVDGLRKMLAG